MFQPNGSKNRIIFTTRMSIRCIAANIPYSLAFCISFVYLFIDIIASSVGMIPYTEN